MQQSTLGYPTTSEISLFFLNQIIQPSKDALNMLMYLLYLLLSPITFWPLDSPEGRSTFVTSAGFSRNHGGFWNCGGGSGGGKGQRSPHLEHLNEIAAAAKM